MPRSERKRHAGLAIVLVVLVVSALALLRPAEVGRSPFDTARTWLWKVNYWAFPVEKRADLSALHLNARRDSRARCVACHGEKTNSKLVLHRIHLRSELLTRLECHDCHQRIDLTTRGNRAVVTWVEVGFCRKCHSEFPGLEVGSPMRPEYFERDCTTCHGGDRAPKHDQPYLPTSVPASECKGCHGGRVLPSTVRHERDDWIETHGTEALRAGADSCYRCHDFGLKFCDQCHAKKPPSHLPVERWRTIHPDVAREDTRVCYSCHKLSFCKKCHLNHEEGWMVRHPDFVREEGDSSCTECHSRSACAYCHTTTPGSVESTAVQ